MTHTPHVAIVGAGPSGLFAAQALLRGHEGVRIDVLDRLPAPFGLLRYGVAPDHASMQGIQRALVAPFTSERVRFFGLVELGRSITRDELVAGYDAVIYAAGASEDRRLHVPGEELPGSRSAREFVAWYCGHPDAEAQQLAGIEAAVTFGVGNVAVDVARVLAASPARLAGTDMPGDVLAELRRASVRDVWVVGRRGPQHASFTTPELRELLGLDGVQPVIDPTDVAGIDETDLDRRVRGNLAALREAADRSVPDAHARLHLRFWRRPVAVLGEDAVSGVVLERTLPAGGTSVVGTREQETIACQLVLRAIGYRGRPLAGVAFDDEAGVIPNRGGRVVRPDGTPSPGEYVVGWIKRGPVGVIGTNKSDAAETVALLLDDLAAEAGVKDAARGPEVDALLASHGLEASSFADWEAIDAEERARGEASGRSRVKVASWSQLTDLVRHGRGGGPLEREHEGEAAPAAEAGLAGDDLS
ncbi:NAD(P)-binding protein [Propioniciclava soli]|uniref:NAD(P)-binding protein n=1 Tax=Propioniciclava soli TaxID=2775081 RepID=A0ABZ3C3F0_9ACTN